MRRKFTRMSHDLVAMRRLAVMSACALFCMLAWSATFPPTVIAQQTKDFKKVVDEAVVGEMKRQEIVGVTVGIISKSKVVYTNGYGFADIENKVPASEESIINWASNSKPVVAVLAMQLVEQKQLDLDVSIKEYVPDLPKHLHGITTRHLLCHQSGIPHYANGKIVPSETSLTQSDQLDPVLAIGRFLKSPLIFQPGEKKDYSSYAYVLLSAVVQEAGQEPIAKQIAERITKPLKLDSFQLDVPVTTQPNWSKAYRRVDGRPVQIKDTAHFWKHGAGAYKSNVKDFATFAASLMKTKLMKRTTMAKMRKRQTTNDGKETEMGLGIYVSGKGKTLKVSHNGSQDETRTRMVIFPKQRHGIVVMCNCNHANPGKITTAIYSAFRKYGLRP